MPLFEYRCQACLSSLELLIRTPTGAATEPPACPACGGATERVFSTFAPRGDRSVSASQGVCRHSYGCSCARKK
jgi:putative FmdB family regulatory protein